MNTEALISHIETALRTIAHPRFYETERGFQGEFLAALRRVLPEGFLEAGVLIEQEYQKRLAQHRLTIRPDIIIHEPFDPARHKGRDDGNVAVIELKLNASAQDAQSDFESLAKMLGVLNYPVGIFINIASARTHADAVPQTAKGRITCFAISLQDDGVHIVRETA
jgi:hypothetical protein